MKKIILLWIIVVISLATFSHAGFPDDDEDGVKNSDDKCPNSGGTTVVDQFGCSCQQKTASNCNTLLPAKMCCASDNNPCTDDCTPDDIGKAKCSYVNNKNPCEGGYCSSGKCVKSAAITSDTCPSSLGICYNSLEQCVRKCPDSPEGVVYYCLYLEKLNGDASWAWRTEAEIGQGQCAEKWGACTQFAYPIDCVSEHRGNPKSSIGSCYALDNIFHYGTEELCIDKRVAQKGENGCKGLLPPPEPTTEAVKCDYTGPKKRWVKDYIVVGSQVIGEIENVG